MNVINHLSLKIRLSVVTGLGIFILTATLLWLGHYQYQQKEEEFRSIYLSGLNDIWSAISNSERSNMASNFTPLTRNRKLSAALYRENKASVRDAVGPTATRLKAMNIADNLLIFDKNGKVIFSEKSGDTQPLPAVKRTQRSGKQDSGFGLTSDGRLVNLVTFPLYDRADLVGFGVYEKELAGVAQKIKEANGREIFFFTNTGVLVASTIEESPQLDVTKVALPDYRYIKQDNLVFGISILPLNNDDGKTVGYLVSRDEVTQAHAAQQRLELITYSAAIFILVLLSVGVALYMKRALRPLDDGISHIERIASGDLSKEISNNSNDEFKRLLGAMQHMNHDLRSLVSRVAETSEQLVNTVDDVDQATSHTSKAVNEQKRELELLASALTEMTATAAEAAENIQKLSDSADESMVSTENGNRIVKQSLRDVESLSDEIRKGSDVVQALVEKSQRISSVMEVIKSIAEQTNLLALNAAIEAARAGEQGRGFAVVADEVRNLAAKTQNSTLEIEEVIVALQNGVEEAVWVMTESASHAQASSEQALTIGKTLDAIQQQITMINELSTQVATAAEQQRTTTEEMSKNINRISESADLTSAQSNTTSGIISQLSDISHTLKQEITKFKIS